MSLLRGLIEGRGGNIENPNVRLSGQTLLDMINEYGTSTSSGKSVTPQSAMTFTAVYRSVALLSGTVAGLPLKTYRDGTRDETSVAVLSKPNEDMTKFELWEQAAAHIAMWGNAYLIKVRDASKRVRELYPILPSRVTVERDNGLKLFKIKGDEGKTESVLTSYDILHIPGFGYDGLVGLSPIGAAREAIAGGQSAEEFANKLWSSGMMVSGLIHAPKKVNEETANSIRRKWGDRVAGVKRAYEVAILDQGMEFKQLSLPPQDAQFLESRKFSVTEVARLYGVPPHLLMDVERSTSWGTGIEEQTIGFVTFTVKPGYLQRIEARVTDEVVPRGQYAEFKIDGLLRGASKDRAEIYTRALDPQTGWMTRNEVRGLENLPPDDGAQMQLPLESDVDAEDVASFSRVQMRSLEHLNTNDGGNT